MYKKGKGFRRGRSWAHLTAPPPPTLRPWGHGNGQQDDKGDGIIVILHHFSSSSVTDVCDYTKVSWKQCLKDPLDLIPAYKIKFFRY